MEILGLVRNAENLEWSNDASPEIAKYCKNTRWKTIFSSGDLQLPIRRWIFRMVHHHLEAKFYW